MGFSRDLSEAFDVGFVELVSMVDAGCAEAGGHEASAEAGDLFAVDFDFEALGEGGLEVLLALFEVEGFLFTEDVDKVSEFFDFG